MSLEIHEKESWSRCQRRHGEGDVRVAERSGNRGRYARQVTGRHDDTGLHVAKPGGDAAVGAAAWDGAEGLEVARRAVAVEPNQDGETPIVAAAERGHLEVVVELLRHLDDEGVAVKIRWGRGGATR